MRWRRTGAGSSSGGLGRRDKRECALNLAKAKWRVHQAGWGRDLHARRRFAYLALLMDSYSRMIVGWSLSFSNDTGLARDTLEMAFTSGRPEIHHTDQGGPYGSNVMKSFFRTEAFYPGLTALGSEQKGRKDSIEL